MKLPTLCIFTVLSFAGGTAWAASCNDDSVTEMYCDRLDLTLECLRGNYACDRSSYLGTTFSRGLFYLGQVVAQAEELAREQRMNGAIRIKTREFRSALGPWRATSRDPNWILAIESGNEIIEEVDNKLLEILENTR